MLRRNSSKNKHRRPLSRSKSLTNTISRSPVRLFEAIDPATAERDAHIAAVLSYHRALNRDSNEMSGIPRDPASFYPEQMDGLFNSNRRSLEQNESTKSRPSGSEMASSVRRQQSVRFAGPSAPPRRMLASRASENPKSSCGTDTSLRVLGAMDNRPSSTMSYSRRTHDPHGLTKRYLDSLQASNECYISEDDIALMPSSYRRLRKSRSMFSTFNPLNPGYYFNNGTPEKDHFQHVDHHSTSKKKENDRVLSDYPPRPSTSLSIVKGRRDKTASCVSSRAENDLAVQLARNKFRQQAQEQSRLKPRSSMFFGSRSKRSESSMGFRKSLRNSSNTSTVLSSTFSTHSLSVPKQPGLRNAARKVSRTLRTKLKGLFIRPKSTAMSEVYDEAKVGYESDDENGLRLDDETAHEEASILRVRSHVPALHAVPSSQELKSRKGSVGSIGSTEQQIDDEKSRVTSWTNSTIDTASSMGDLENKQPAFIGEIGANPLPSFQAFTQASPENQELGSPSGSAVDSQRVYSALMKRVDKIKEQEAALTRSINKMSIRGAPTVPSGMDKGWTSSTIRCVRAEDDVFGDCANLPMSQENRSSGNFAHAVDQIAGVDLAVESQMAESVEDLPSPNKCIPGAPRNLSATLTHRSSAFFASPTCHMFRTTSPYRRALRENMRASEDQDRTDLLDSKYLKSLSEVSLPTRRTSSAGSEKDARITYAESVYSCKTEDVRQILPKSTLSPGTNLPKLSAIRSPGDVKTTASPEPTTLHHRDVSTASSVEWKTWLSAKVSNLEGPALPSKNSPGDKANFFSTLGHVREAAQFDSPNECFKQVRIQSNGSPIRNTVNLVEGNARSNSSSTVLGTLSSKTVVQGDENEVPKAIAHQEWQEDWSPILPSDRPRAGPSLLTARSGYEMNKPDTELRTLEARPFNILGRPESTPDEALQKRRSRTRANGWSGSPARSSPGLTSAVERQFLNTGTGSPIRRAGLNTSQSTPRSRRRTAGKGENPEDTIVRSRDSDGSLLGSKQMVDVFLNNRRKRVRENGPANGAGSSPTIFL